MSNQNNYDENDLNQDNQTATDNQQSESVDENNEKFEYVSKSEEVLKQTAMDIYNGHIFTDSMVTTPSLLGAVFMPLIFADKDLLKEIQEIVGMIYEYYSKAGPRSINGMPIFMSMCILDKYDAEKVIVYHDEYKNMMDKMKAEWPNIETSNTKTEF